MALTAFNKIGKAFDDGQVHYQYVYKAAIPASGTAGFFVDANQSSGIPVYNAYAGSALTFTPLTGNKNQGIYPGNFHSGKTKYLSRMQVLEVSGGSPNLFYLCDYLGFYPLVDCDNTDQQDMDNTVSLTRQTSGEGVRAVLIASAPMVSTASITVSYTNSSGVSGRTSTFNVIPATTIGVCATGTSPSLGGAGQVSPFMPLASGDIGIRSIDSVTFAAGAGGFVVIALVKPLAQIPTYETGVPSEKVFGIEGLRLPIIDEGAYLNFLISRGGTTALNMRAELIFINT